MPISNIIPNAKALIAMRTDPDNRPELNRALDYVKGQLEGFTVECFERSGATSILAYRGDVRPEKFKIILNGHLDVIRRAARLFGPAAEQMHFRWGSRRKGKGGFP